MIKTNEHNVSFNDLTVDTAGLQALTHAGIKTATEIGVAAGAKIYVGRRVLWNVAKIRKYLDKMDNIKELNELEGQLETEKQESEDED